jgi:4-hydroxybutyryl-CoA dehydratase/vinylacetyl-CoA-Delta-isomerase
MALGIRHKAGVWVSNSLLAHTNKVHVATLPYITKRICQEIGGGAVETGCFPAYDDLTSPDYGEFLQETLRGGSGSAESRARIVRLAEWLTLGAGVPGCMHGGGSPDGARLVVKNETPLEEYVRYASQIAGLSEEITESNK